MTSAPTRLRLSSPGSTGYSLVEVIVAMLISCIMVTAVMGVAVTGKQGTGKGMRRMMFDQGIAQVSAEVKQYVTACGCTKNAGAACPAPACTQVLGPNTNNAGVATWYISGAPGAVPPGTIVDAGVVGGATRNTWALSCGPHYITGVMNGGAVDLEANPYQGYILYTVNYPSGCAGIPLVNDTPSITYTANWTEP